MLKIINLTGIAAPFVYIAPRIQILQAQQDAEDYQERTFHYQHQQQ